MSAVHAFEACRGHRARPGHPRPPPPPVLRRVDREPRAPRLLAPRARTSWATRARSSWPVTIACSWSARSRSRRPATTSSRCSAAGRSTRSASGSAASTTSPRDRRLTALRPDLEAALAIAEDTVVSWPASSRPTSSASRGSWSLRHPIEYPMNDGRIVSNDGLDLAPGDWEAAFEEDQVGWSNALQARTHAGEVYLLGPSSRITLAGDRLHPRAAEALAATGLRRIRSGGTRSGASSPAPSSWSMPPPRRSTSSTTTARRSAPAVPLDARPGRRRLGHRGTARPPLPSLRAGRGGPRGDGPHRAPDQPEPGRHRGGPRDLRASVLDLPHDVATHRLEQLIRSYDPCISCATHFLDLRVERRS